VGGGGATVARAVGTRCPQGVSELSPAAAPAHLRRVDTADAGSDNGPLWLSGGFGEPRSRVDGV